MEIKWLRQLFSRSKSPEIHVVPEIVFLGEKDGATEREIKARWRPFLVENSLVQRVYLAIVRYHDLDARHVALCIRHSTGDDKGLVSALQESFREMFSPDNSLDIIFITPEQESRLQRVCRPFHEAMWQSTYRYPPPRHRS